VFEIGLISRIASLVIGIEVAAFGVMPVSSKILTALA
jgi:hypothetical protein